MIPDLGSSRGDSTTSKIGLYPGHLEERLTGGTQRTTWLMARYNKVVKVSRLFSRKDLVHGDLDIYLLVDREPVEIGNELRCGD